MLVTPFLAALFALLFVFLSLAVIRIRFSEKISLGDGDNKALRVASRAHANFIEYVPLTLLLLWFIETALFDSSFALMLGAVLFVARLMHIVGMHKPRDYMILRQIGMLATLAVMIVASIRILWHYVPI